MRKTILILGAGTEHQIAIKLAKNLGYKVIVVDADPKAPGLTFADVAIVADIKNINKMVEVGKKYKVDGVFVHAVEISHIVSRIAKALGLPGIDPKVADRTTFKSQRIKFLQKARINVPKFFVVKSLVELEKSAQKIGFPVVVKPIDNAGSRGVRIVENARDLKKAYNELLKYTHSQEALVEEFLQGPEISTESVVYNGKIYTTGFGDRNYQRNKEFYPYFMEDGHNVPSILPQKLQKKIIKEIEKAIKALGIKWGVAKGDILLHNNKVYILEMASRTSGGWFCAGTVPLATGVNILKSLIRMSVNDTVDLNDLKPTIYKVACQRYIIPNQSGKFVKFIGVNKARKMPGVKMLEMFKSPVKGESIRKATNHAERFGQIIAVGKDIKDATKKCENAIKCIKIVLQNSNI